MTLTRFRKLMCRNKKSFDQFLRIVDQWTDGHFYKLVSTLKDSDLEDDGK